MHIKDCQVPFTHGSNECVKDATNFWKTGQWKDLSSYIIIQGPPEIPSGQIQ